MKKSPTSKIPKKLIGSLVCVFFVSGFVTDYAIQQIEARLTSQSIAVPAQPALKKTTGTVAQNSDDSSTMPPPPDMGAIFTAQKTEEDVNETMNLLAEIDQLTTGSVPTSETSLSATEWQKTTLVIPVKTTMAVLIQKVPIPVPSPKKRSRKPDKLVDKRPWNGTPDVLVLGDSQISVSAGPMYQKFFSNLPSICKTNKAGAPAATNIDFNRTASLGVRSTSLHSWVARSGRAKGTICDVDKKWGVNAGAWGMDGNSARKYVQIGKGKNYKFCKPKASAFESMFAKGYYKPKLLVMAFLGNSADRWANSKKSALKDVRSTLAQIPKDTACIFMTSAPVYSKKVNRVRMKAQKNIAEAFAKTGNRCTVVKGFTPQIRAEIEGNKAYFRKTKSGKIADKFHPNARAIMKYVKHNTASLCKAYREQLG